jgi:hypothetical protein
MAQVDAKAGGEAIASGDEPKTEPKTELKIEAAEGETAAGAAPAEPAIVPIEVAEALLSQLVRTAPKLDRSRFKAAEAEPAPAWADAPRMADSMASGSEHGWSQYDWQSSEPVVTAPPLAAESPIVPPSSVASKRKPLTASVGTFAVLAASMAIAAALGAMGGALGASGLMQLGPAPTQEAAPAAAVDRSDETRAIRSALAQLRTDLGALKSSLEAGTKHTNGQLASANTQIAKMSERFDRIERAQAEPAAKIGKAIEVLERLEKRSDANKETTGSVPALQQQAAVAPAQQRSVNGWSVREVYRGIAVLKGPRFGLIEVEAGDMVPGIGRVEAVRRQDGRWIVVTSKGVIRSSN